MAIIESLPLESDYEVSLTHSFDQAVQRGGVETLEVVDINHRLEKLERSELSMGEQVELVTFEEGELLAAESANFFIDFTIEVRAAGEWGLQFVPRMGFLSNHVRLGNKVIKYGRERPITDSELESLRLSVQGDQTHSFRSEDWEGATLRNHVNRLAFHRLLVLYPLATKTLVHNMNRQHPDDTWKSLSELRDKHSLELGAAYKLMARLVDANDSQVKNHDGTLDPLYLWR